MNILSHSVIIVALYFISKSYCEMYTSTTDMEALLGIEANLISKMKSYLMEEQEKLNQLRK